MDNTLKYNKIFYNVFFAFAAMIVLFILCAVPLSNTKAKAITFLELNEIVCDSLNEAKLLSDGIAEYTEKQYDTVNNPYQRNIKLRYTLSGVNSVRFGYSVNGQEEILEEPINTSGLEEVSYDVGVSGIITVNCYAYDEDNFFLENISTTVKSDLVALDTVPTVTSMNDWVGKNVNFDITMNWSNISDNLSGSGKVFYMYDYTDPSFFDIAWAEADTENTQTITATISGNGKFKVFCFDKAENGTYNEYIFNKFDFTAPAAPTIEVTPNVNLAFSNGYAKEYTVSIVYNNDMQSGNADTQYYLINDRIMTYYGSFTLKDAMRYTITASTTDKVGNKSENTSYIINSDAFDIYEPVITQKTLSIDLTKEIIAEFSFWAVDNLSGIDYAYCQTLDSNLTKGAGSLYRIVFSPYGYSNIYFDAYDKAGNVASDHFAINYFEDTALSEKIRAYNELYLGLNREEYNVSVLEKIDNEYAKINTMLMASSSQESSLSASFSEIDRLVEGRSEYAYVIQSVPIIVSTMLSFTVDESDFEGYKKGDKITLALNSAISNGTDYVKLSGFSKGFVDYFHLSVYFNEEEKTDLNQGITINMNLPGGYLERKFMLIDMSNNQIVESTVINNKITFVCKGSASYAMVISGDKEIIGSDTPKYINVFGKKMKVGVFFGVLGGVFGGAAVIITLLIIIKRKKGY